MCDCIIDIPQDEWENDYEKSYNIQKSFFWGFNAKDSDAPPKKDVQGRVNPIGISCLYTSNTIKTAIYEVQPTIGQIISVAKIVTLRDLNIFNFNFYNAFKHSKFLDKSIVEIKKKAGISVEYIKIVFDTLSELFSKPSLGNTENYYVTQYLSEFIKDKGFDGLIH